MEKIHLLVIGNTPLIKNTADRLRDEGFEVTQCSRPAEVGRVLKLRHDVGSAILDTDLPTVDAFAIYKLLHDPMPRPTLMLVSKGGYSQLNSLNGHKPELDDYLAKPFGLEELVLRVKALLVRSGYELEAKQPLPSNGGGHKRRPAGNGEVIAVFSPKGGVGKTTIAANLATALAKGSDKRVALIDADLTFGTVAEMLNIRNSPTIFDLLPAVETVSLDDLEGVMVQHPSGMKVLLAPPKPILAEKVPSALLSRVIALARAAFDYVVVDTPASYDERTLEVLDSSTRILVVLTPEIGVISNAVHFLTIANDLGYGSKLALVVNRANTGINPRELESTLGQPIFATITSDGPAVVEAANAGEPVVVRSKNSAVSQDLMRLAASVEKGEAIPPDRSMTEPKVTWLNLPRMMIGTSRKPSTSVASSPVPVEA